MIKEFYEKGLIVTNDRSVSPAGLVQMARQYGRLFRASVKQVHPLHPEIHLISNHTQDGQPLGLLGDGAIEWHSDLSYLADAYDGSILYGVETDPSCHTDFLDLREAYDKLPDSLKRELDSVVGVYALSTFEKTHTQHNLKETHSQFSYLNPVERKLICTHPITSRQSLYLSPSLLIGFKDFSDKDFKELSSRLLQHCLENVKIYRHQWSDGDLLFIDNLSYMHRRDAAPNPRLLWRLNFAFMT